VTAEVERAPTSVWARRDRDAMLAAAAASLGVAATVGAVVGVLRVVAAIRRHSPGWQIVAEGVRLAGDLVAIAGFAAVAVAFLAAGERRIQSLRAGATLVEASFALHLVAICLLAFIVFEGTVPGDYWNSQVLSALSELFLIVAVVVAVTGFERSADDRMAKDGSFGKAAFWVAGGFGLAALSGLFSTLFYGSYSLYGKQVVGLLTQTIGAGVLALGAALAGAAFLHLRRSPATEPAPRSYREESLSLAAWVIALGYAIVAVGELLFAAYHSAFPYLGVETAAIWITVLAPLASVVAAVCAAVGFSRGNAAP
jgi:hypothetical protein